MAPLPAEADKQDDAGKGASGNAEEVHLRARDVFSLLGAIKLLTCALIVWLLIYKFTHSLIHSLMVCVY